MGVKRRRSVCCEIEKILGVKNHWKGGLWRARNGRSHHNIAQWIVSDSKESILKKISFTFSVIFLDLVGGLNLVWNINLWFIWLFFTYHVIVVSFNSSTTTSPLPFTAIILFNLLLSIINLRFWFDKMESKSLTKTIFYITITILSLGILFSHVWTNKDGASIIIVKEEKVVSR